MSAVVAETDLGFNRHCANAIKEMVIQGVLTDAVIGPLTTVAGLRNVSAAAVPETSLRFYQIYQKLIDEGEAIGVLTDATVAAANTVDGLLELFTDQDPTIEGANGSNWSFVAA